MGLKPPVALKISNCIAGAVALCFCFLSMRDVPHNPIIRNPLPSMTVLWVLVALIVVTGALALMRSSRKTAGASFIASGLGILFSLILACV